MGVRCRILGIMLGCSVYVGYLVKLFLFVFILGVMKPMLKPPFWILSGPRHLRKVKIRGEVYLVFH
jgi:hypothetical protein